MSNLFNIPSPPSSTSANIMEIDAASSSQTPTAAPAAADANYYWAKAQSNLQQLQSAAAPPTPSPLDFSQLSGSTYAMAAANMYPYSAGFVSPAFPNNVQFAPTAPPSISAASRLASHRRFRQPTRAPFRAANHTPYTPRLPQQPQSRFPNRHPTTPQVTASNKSGNFIYSDFFNRMIPDSVKAYCDRAFDALPSEDLRPRLEFYLRERINPLLESGVAARVNWETEQLPHKVDFKVTTSWVPASQLKGPTSSHSQRRAATPPRKQPPPPSLMTPDSGSSSSSGPLPPPHFSNIPPSLITPLIPLAKNEKKSKKKKGSQSETSKYGQTPLLSELRQSAKSSGGSKMTLPESEDDERRKQLRAQRFLSDTPTGAAVLGRSSGGSSQKGRYTAPNDYRSSHSASKRNFKSMIEKCSLKRRRRIVGTCDRVDKPYFRLTTEADPALVRPFPVLVQALDRVRKLYAANGDYAYANDQLKSIRQDLITQDIRNGFSVAAYEEHVLLAIKHKDREEFNQSQQQLKALYDRVKAPKRLVFTAYRLLYYVYVEAESDATKLLQGFNSEIESSEELSFAQKVYHMYTCKNYELLLRLYAEATTVMRQVMDFFIERERNRYFKCILASYRPTLTVDALASLLHLSKTAILGYLEGHGLQLEGDVLDIRKCANVMIANS